MADLEVLYEDNHLLVLVKPGNLPTQPTPQTELSLEVYAKAWLKDKYKKTGSVFLHAIHRLDRPVSGIVVFAKTSKALSRLQLAMRKKETKKIYRGWVEGILTSDGTFEDYLIHGDHIAVKSHAGNLLAKRCRLNYTVIKKTVSQTLVEIELETGRYHQIRAQFGFRGYPIVGDKKYGSRQVYQKDKIALHHTAFSIMHPIKKEMMTFESTLPLFI